MRKPILKCIDPPLSWFVTLFILLALYATASNSNYKKSEICGAAGTAEKLWKALSKLLLSVNIIPH